MKKSKLLTACLAFFAISTASAANVDVGINIGVPGIVVPPPAVVVQPAPVYVQRPAPVYVQPSTVYIEEEHRDRHHHRHGKDHDHGHGHGHGHGR